MRLVQGICTDFSLTADLFLSVDEIDLFVVSVEIRASVRNGLNEPRCNTAKGLRGSFSRGRYPETESPTPTCYESTDSSQRQLLECSFNFIDRLQSVYD